MQKKLVFIISTAVLLQGCPTKPPVTSNDTSNTTVNVDSLAIVQKRIVDKLQKTTTVSSVKANISGYELPNEFVNLAPSLVGRLIRVQAVGNRINIVFVGSFNYLQGGNFLTSDIVTKEPYFDAYIDKGATTDVSSAAGVAANLEANQSANINYRTILFSAGKDNFIDLVKLQKDAKDYNFTQYNDLWIVNSVMINQLKYSKFRKFEGSLNGATSIVNVNGSMYYKEGTDINTYEAFISLATVPIKSNKVDTSSVAPVVVNNKIKVTDLKSLMVQKNKLHSEVELEIKDFAMDTLQMNDIFKQK